MINYKIHLIRTGSTSDGMWQQYVGQKDLPLCQKGEDMLYKLSANYEYPYADIVYASSLNRCIQTAEILYPQTFTEQVENLRDMNLGEFSGKSYEELKDNPNFNAWLKNSVENPPPGGERADDFTSRIVVAAAEIITGMMESKVQNVAIISHAGVIMTLLAAIALPKRPIHEWKVNNGCGFTLVTNPQMWMRDRSCEVLCSLPVAPGEEGDFFGDFYSG